MRAIALFLIAASVACASGRVLPHRQLLQTQYGDQYWCPNLPAEYGSCESGVAIKDWMKSPSKDATPAEGVQAFMQAATDNFAEVYSISCKPSSAPRLVCQNSQESNSWLVIFDIGCDVGRGTLGAWGVTEGGNGAISGTVSYFSYNNLICNAGIQKASGSSGSAAPAPAAPIGVDDGSTLLEGLPDLGGLGSSLGLPDLGGLGQGQDWQKLMNAKAVVCDPLPTEVATCGSGTLSAYGSKLSDLGGFIDQAVNGWNTNYAPYTSYTCTNPGPARLACSLTGDSKSKFAVFDADCGSAGRVTLSAWGTDDNGDGKADWWSLIEFTCKKI